DDDGKPRLDFTVRDKNHANDSRALSTLSGGETFLVSLAMALALADYRQQDLRMETLLLDEGFGTLDQETLSTALSLLKNLHMNGERQVGLISHVEVLKERIPHRIEVSRLGGGRSKIDVISPSKVALLPKINA
ncbi:MAG: SbcC/MukB-like Walker B domain-containing protein, partial [Bradymonadaceae bacterium]